MWINILVTLFKLYVLLMLLCCFKYEYCHGDVIEFEQIQHYSTLNGISPFATQVAVSAVHCAVLCLEQSQCQSFAFDCTLLYFTHTFGECNLYNSFVTSQSSLASSYLLCYVQRKIAGINWTTPPPTTTPFPTTTTSTLTTASIPITVTTGPTTTTQLPVTTTTTSTTTSTVPTTSTTTTTPLPTTTTTTPTTTTTTTPTTTTTTTPTTTTTTTTTSTTAPPTTTTSASSSIRGLVNGDFRLCSSSSGRDFVMITDDAVYVYDDISSLTTGPCSGPMALSAMFPGYSSLPAASDISCVLLYQSNVEIYADGYVYTWQNQGGSFAKNQNSRQTYDAFLGNTASAMIGSKTIQWCALRAKNNVERHFAMDDGTYVLKDSQAGTYSYVKTSVIRHNGFNLNPWGDLPDNVIAACGYTSQQNENFALIDASHMVYSYALIHSPDNNNPTMIVTGQGIWTT